MASPATISRTEGLDDLTDKEKETLRLIVRGHDAKSTATALSLSVHTINDRLRVARRKLGVTSSREAARLLLDSEGETPETLAGKELGDARGGGEGESSEPSNGSHTGARPDRRWRFRTFAGALPMTFALAAALALASAVATHEPPATTSPEQVARDHASEEAARAWLTLTDANDWQASYAATGSQFRELNTLEMWSDASDQARAPLGPLVSREAIAYRNLNAPPHGYLEVQFRTDFEQRKGVVETVVLERENGELRVVGYQID